MSIAQVFDVNTWSEGLERGTMIGRAGLSRHEPRRLPVVELPDTHHEFDRIGPPIGSSEVRNVCGHLLKLLGRLVQVLYNVIHHVDRALISREIQS